MGTPVASVRTSLPEDGLLWSVPLSAPHQAVSAPLQLSSADGVGAYIPPTPPSLASVTLRQAAL